MKRKELKDICDDFKLKKTFGLNDLYKNISALYGLSKLDYIHIYLFV